MPEESVADFAKREGISARRVRALIQSEQLAARQVGKMWLIERATARRPAVSRPLGPKMRAGVLAQLSGDAPSEMSASERSRLRRYLEELRGADDPDRLLAAWFPSKPPLSLAVAPSDLGDLARDDRIVKTGFSDPRAQIAAAAQLECRVAAADLNALRREFLLRPSDQPNVIMHLAAEGPPSPLPLGLLLVDLANHVGVRERSRVADLLTEYAV